MKLILYIVSFLLANSAYSQAPVYSKIPNQVSRESIFSSDLEAINKNLARDGIAHVILELKIDSQNSDIVSNSQLTAHKT